MMRRCKRAGQWSALFFAFILLLAGESNAGGPGQYGLIGTLNSLGITDGGTRPPLSTPPRSHKACLDEEGLGPVDLPVILGNRSSLAINLITEDGPPDVSNLIRPGETHSTMVYIPEERVTFHAVYDGTIVASQTWSRDPARPCKVPVVLFDDSDGRPALRIVTGERSY